MLFGGLSKMSGWGPLADTKSVPAMPAFDLNETSGGSVAHFDRNLHSAVAASVLREKPAGTANRRFGVSDSTFRRNDGVWLNEPKRWGRAARQPSDRHGQSTDFWRKAHHGFNSDSGHFIWFLPSRYARVASCLKVAPHFATRASCCLVTCQITK